MTLRLNVLDDLGTGPDAELTLDAQARAQRQAAYDQLASKQIAVRLGELTRTDDGVLGYSPTTTTPASPRSPPRSSPRRGPAAARPGSFPC